MISALARLDAYWSERQRAPFPWTLVGLVLLALSPALIVAVAVVRQ